MSPHCRLLVPDDEDDDEEEEDDNDNDNDDYDNDDDDDLLLKCQYGTSQYAVCAHHADFRLLTMIQTMILLATHRPTLMLMLIFESVAGCW